MAKEKTKHDFHSLKKLLKQISSESQKQTTGGKGKIKKGGCGGIGPS